MNENILSIAARLSDEALLSRIKVLAVRERGATVELVAHLAALDGRKSHLGEGPGSLYLYCRDQLHLSEDAAWNRAASANAVRRYPVILDWLADGSLNVTTVRVLRPVLTPENHLAVLAEARHRTRKEVEVIVARLNPKPDVPSTVRKLPAGPAPLAREVSLVGEGSAPPPPGAAGPTSPATTTPITPQPAAAVPVQRPVVAPLTPERYRFQFTASKEIHDKFRRVQDLLCRDVPDGDVAAIFDRGLDVLLAELAKRKTAATENPRPPRGTKDGSRHIPAHVRRAVWKRDEARCAFVGRTGRCSERRYLECHHIHPYGHQGPATVDNIALRCRAHNVYESELVFGPFVSVTGREPGTNHAVSGQITPVPERVLGLPAWARTEARM